MHETNAKVNAIILHCKWMGREQIIPDTDGKEFVWGKGEFVWGRGESF